MAEGQRLDGRYYIARMVGIINKVNSQLPQAGNLDAAQVPIWQGKLQALVDDTPHINEKLFVKTQGGTDLAKDAHVKVLTLESLVQEGIKGLPAAEATMAVDEAVETVNKSLGFFIHKSKTTIIRMT